MIILLNCLKIKLEIVSVFTLSQSKRLEINCNRPGAEVYTQKLCGSFNKFKWYFKAFLSIEAVNLVSSQFLGKTLNCQEDMNGLQRVN